MSAPLYCQSRQATASKLSILNFKNMEQKKLIPPFSAETAAEKLQLNQEIWNTRDAEKISQLYTEDIEWLDRITFLTGRAAVKNYLTKKFENELGFKTKKEVWGAKENRNAIRFEDEWHDHTGQWFHSYGNEQLEFDENGLIRKRFGCISDKAIEAHDRTLI
jgi:nuclear transport factor 2 (NTF2) superfamily protein